MTLSPVMSDTTRPTPESNARDIASLTLAVDKLIAEFNEPEEMEWANVDQETLDKVVELLDRNAEGLLSLEAKLEKIVGVIGDIVEQQGTTVRQIGKNTEALSRHSQRFEGTRQLVAQNASDFAQMSARQARQFEEICQLLACNASDFAQMSAKQDRQFEETKESLGRLVEEN